MKKILLSVFAALFISLIIPLIIVEFMKPDTNAESTKPLPSPTVSSSDMEV